MIMDENTQPNTPKPSMKKRKQNTALRFTLVLFILSILGCLFLTFYYIPSQATWIYGASSPALSTAPTATTLGSTMPAG